MLAGLRRRKSVLMLIWVLRIRIGSIVYLSGEVLIETSKCVHRDKLINSMKRCNAKLSKY